MPKIVTDKERIIRLELELAETKRAHKNVVSALRDECRSLRAKYKYVNTRYVQLKADVKTYSEIIEACSKLQQKNKPL